MPVTECHNLNDIMTSRSIVILNMSKNHAFLVVAKNGVGGSLVWPASAR